MALYFLADSENAGMHRDTVINLRHLKKISQLKIPPSSFYDGVQILMVL